MVWQVLHITELLLWMALACSVGYILFFALFSWRRKGPLSVQQESHDYTRFLVIIPAYREDRVICQSVEAILHQDYPQHSYRIVVVSDHMQPATNERLSTQEITLLQPDFEKSSKAKALQFVMQHIDQESAQGAFDVQTYDRVVILDADNIVQPTFLSRLHAVCLQGYDAIQCHRTAKNADNNIAALDGVSEEINNSIFRRAHNNIGLSSALIGSGMCFDYQWFHDHVSHLSTAVEDRELESLLLLDGFYIKYEEDIFVMDEKVSSSDNFQRQRLRWMTGQIQALFSMLPKIPYALRTGNINYIDKTIQQALIPRSILLVLLPVIACIITFCSWQYAIKWWALFACLCLALFIAIPRQLLTASLFSKAFALPTLVWRMMKNIVRIDKSDTTFHHTEHGSNNL